MCVQQYPILAKFGTMHLIAANISIWIFSTISEVIADISSNVTAEDRIVSQLEVNESSLYLTVDNTGVMLSNHSS